MAARSLFEITVWDIVEGGVVGRVWRGCDEDLAWCKNTFGDDSRFQIVIDRQWEEDEE